MPKYDGKKYVKKKNLIILLSKIILNGPVYFSKKQPVKCA